MTDAFQFVREAVGVLFCRFFGTDEFGDKLANGTYLYRMKIQDDSNEMKHRATKLDNYMQRGYGKLVIIR